MHLLRLLADLGLGFDCASSGEIQMVLDLGVHPSRIVFSQPCKSMSALRMASHNGVLLSTFDNADELDKIKQTSPEMHLLLRIYAQDDTAKVCLGKKFGALLETTESLLLRAWELGLEVVGVNFHIGTTRLCRRLLSRGPPSNHWRPNRLCSVRSKGLRHGGQARETGL